MVTTFTQCRHDLFDRLSVIYEEHPENVLNHNDFRMKYPDEPDHFFVEEVARISRSPPARYGKSLTRWARCDQVDSGVSKPFLQPPRVDFPYVAVLQSDLRKIVFVGCRCVPVKLIRVDDPKTCTFKANTHPSTTREHI